MSDNPREYKHPVQEIAAAVGGKIEEVGRLPDGSGFATVSMPIPKDHWLYQGDEVHPWGISNVPPMPFRMGSTDYVTVQIARHTSLTLSRQEMVDRIRAAGKYAARCATMNGKHEDFDPDALLQNLVIGFLGYWTADGLSGESFGNPKERAQWCCDGDGKGGHHARCRYSMDDYAGNSVSPPQQS
jgi:hypothetical protein